MAEDRVVMASTFKAECLAIIDRVEIDRVPVVITKRGRPVARLVAYETEERDRSTSGSVHLVAEEDAFEAQWGREDEPVLIGHVRPPLHPAQDVPGAMTGTVEPDHQRGRRGTVVAGGGGVDDLRVELAVPLPYPGHDLPQPGRQRRQPLGRSSLPARPDAR